MLVDFHVHSTASDGTVPRAELVAVAVKGEYAAVALTDHDNCDGIGEFLSAPGARPPARVAGIELSIDPGAGFDKFHLLGLGIDFRDAALKRLLARVLEGRNGRNRRIIENFARIGIDIPADEIAGYAHGEVLARPHFARWLVDNGYSSDVKEAFDRYLASDSPADTCCYEKRWRPSQTEAFEAIHGAGGLCVMAHPRYWCDRWKHEGCDFAAAGREFMRLKEAGLDAVEAVYQANTPEENIAFSRLADEARLLKTAGSDFHGSTKKNVTLGMDVPESFIAPFLEAVRFD
jgi:predicted metal-dependent phosphoesterase TrpH